MYWIRVFFFMTCISVIVPLGHSAHIRYNLLNTLAAKLLGLNEKNTLGGSQNSSQTYGDSSGTTPGSTTVNNRIQNHVLDPQSPGPTDLTIHPNLTSHTIVNSSNGFPQDRSEQNLSISFSSNSLNHNNATSDAKRNEVHDNTDQNVTLSIDLGGRSGKIGSNVLLTDLSGKYVGPSVDVASSPGVKYSNKPSQDHAKRYVAPSMEVTRSPRIKTSSVSSQELGNQSIHVMSGPIAKGSNVFPKDPERQYVGPLLEVTSSPRPKDPNVSSKDIAKQYIGPSADVPSSPGVKGSNKASEDIDRQYVGPLIEVINSPEVNGSNEPSQNILPTQNLVGPPLDVSHGPVARAKDYNFSKNLARQYVDSSSTASTPEKVVVKQNEGPLVDVPSSTGAKSSKIFTKEFAAHNHKERGSNVSNQDFIEESPRISIKPDLVGRNGITHAANNRLLHDITRSNMSISRKSEPERRYGKDSGNVINQDVTGKTQVDPSLHVQDSSGGKGSNVLNRDIGVQYVSLSKNAPSSLGIKDSNMFNEGKGEQYFGTPSFVPGNPEAKGSDVFPYLIGRQYQRYPSKSISLGSTVELITNAFFQKRGKNKINQSGRYNEETSERLSHGQRYRDGASMSYQQNGSYGQRSTEIQPLQRSVFYSNGEWSPLTIALMLMRDSLEKSVFGTD